MESPDPKKKGGTMADKPLAYKIVATKKDGSIYAETYASPEDAPLVAKTLRQELLTVTVEPVDELPDGVKL